MAEVIIMNFIPSFIVLVETIKIVKTKHLLKPCVDRVIQIDSSDDLYLDKVNAPPLIQNTFQDSHYDGTVIANSLLFILKFLKSKTIL